MKITSYYSTIVRATLLRQVQSMKIIASSDHSNLHDLPYLANTQCCIGWLKDKKKLVKKFHKKKRKVETSSDSETIQLTRAHV